jgi:hypothetical protein
MVKMRDSVMEFGRFNLAGTAEQRRASAFGPVASPAHSARLLWYASCNRTTMIPITGIRDRLKIAEVQTLPAGHKHERTICSLVPVCQPADERSKVRHAPQPRLLMNVISITDFT